MIKRIQNVSILYLYCQDSGGNDQKLYCTVDTVSSVWTWCKNSTEIRSTVIEFSTLTSFASHLHTKSKRKLLESIRNVALLFPGVPLIIMCLYTPFCLLSVIVCIYVYLCHNYDFYCSKQLQCLVHTKTICKCKIIERVSLRVETFHTQFTTWIMFRMLNHTFKWDTSRSSKWAMRCF